MQYLGIIQKYSRVRRRDGQQSLLDIVRQSHKELIWSRLLAHFLDPSRGLEMSSLWANALLKLLDIPAADERVEIVDLEHMTANGKLIDILIITNRRILVVENKIYAGLYNDFAEYARHAGTLSQQFQRPHSLILLTLFPMAMPNDIDFTNISWERLIKEVRSECDFIFRTATNQQSIYFQEFLSMASGVLREHKSNEEFIEFVVGNRGELDRLFSDLDILRNDLYSKSARFEQAMESHKALIGFKSGLWKEKKNPFFAVTFFDLLSKTGIKIAVDVVFEPQGTKVQIFTRTRSKISLLIPKLLEAGIETSNDEDHRQLWKEKFRRDEDLSNIAAQIAGLLGKISGIAVTL